MEPPTAKGGHSSPPPELYELTRIFFDLQVRGLRLWDEYDRNDDLRSLQAYANYVRALRAHLGLVEGCHK
jgi:hypothetical protein